MPLCVCERDVSSTMVALLLGGNVMRAMPVRAVAVSSTCTLASDVAE